MKTNVKKAPLVLGAKHLWTILITVLSVAVIAFGGLLLYQPGRQGGPERALTSAPPGAGVVTEKEAVVKERPIRAATTRTEKPALLAQSPAVSDYSAPAPARDEVIASVKPLCAHCGTVVSVTAVERDGAPSGLGVVAGGVLGALVGNQVGSGSGRTAATVLGAVGGGWAGNTAEKKMKKVIVYQIRMQMEDGSSRTVEQMSSVAVGEKVTIEGNALRRNDGSLSMPMPAQPGSQPAAPSMPSGAG